MNNSINDFDAANHSGYDLNGSPVNYDDLKIKVKWVYIDSKDGVDHWMGIPKEE